MTGKDVLLSSTVIGDWSNMARTGNPNVPASAANSHDWPDCTSGRPLSLRDSGSLTSTNALRQEHHCSFWSTVPPPTVR